MLIASAEYTSLLLVKQKAWSVELVGDFVCDYFIPIIAKDWIMGLRSDWLAKLIYIY